MYILLCHMILLHAVGSILEVDVQLLENEFNNGHRDGESQHITISVIEGWHLHKHHSNGAFESFISLDLVLVILEGKMFNVSCCHPIASLIARQ